MAIEKVAIVGRGAVGLLHGTVIAEHLGCDAVEFVMDDERFARKGADAVMVNGSPCPIRTIPASAAVPVDLVILAVKGPGLVGALDTMEPLVGPDTKIMSLLNGVMSEERVAERYGWQRTVISITQGMDAVFIGGELTFSHPGEIRFGAAPGTEPGVVEDIDGFLDRAGIVHAVEEDIRHRIWTKLMLNVGVNQTCMVYGGTYGSVCDEDGEQYRSLVAAMREARVVARAEGVAVTEDDLTQMVELLRTLDPEGMPSMAQDRINRKPTEVEEFSGTIIRLAERHGVLVPQNRWLYAQIRAIEAAW
ncbi:ketopantoate reductase family protein [Collinsella tanakaei]|nr:ketopantoate reductase family protein [Collinsella tanakaei]